MPARGSKKLTGAMVRGSRLSTTASLDCTMMYWSSPADTIKPFAGDAAVAMKRQSVTDAAWGLRVVMSAPVR